MNPREVRKNYIQTSLIIVGFSVNTIVIKTRKLVRTGYIESIGGI
jgi:hypothetical protein